MKNRTCAYCGSSGELTREHVVPKGLFVPAAGPDTNQPRLITVQACLSCNSGWSSDEPYFRNVLAMCGPITPATEKLWSEKTSRSFAKADGRKQAADLANCVSIDRAGVWTVYPGKDLRIMRIIKKIVCGLSCHHDLRWPLPEEDVTCALWPYEVPSEFDASWDWNVVRNGVFRYAMGTHVDPEAESVWVLQFFGRVNFLACVQPRAINPSK